MKKSELYRDTLESVETSQGRINKEITSHEGVNNIEKSYFEWNKEYAGEEPKKVPIGEEVIDPREEKYQEALKLAEQVDYKEEDLQEFLSGDWHESFEEVLDGTRIFPRFKIDGLFVSAFAERLDCDEVVLPCLGDTGYLGYKNEKDLVIEGDAAVKLGRKMKGGSIHVEGSVNSCGGESQGGEIRVKEEIDDIGDNCSARVYSWRENCWEKVER
jgi:hypothetical protein